MDVLLLLSETASRAACADYLSLRGYNVDSADDLQRGEALLRFRVYDSIVTDLDLGDDGHGAADRVIALARQRNAGVVSVVLTTVEPVAADDSIITLTKPLPLERIVESVQARRGDRTRTVRRD